MSWQLCYRGICGMLHWMNRIFSWIFRLWTQQLFAKWVPHNTDVIMGTIVSQITSLTIVYSSVYSAAGQRKYQSSAFTGLCAGNSPETGEFPAQMASNAENVSIWWRHHEARRGACVLTIHSHNTFRSGILFSCVKTGTYKFLICALAITENCAQRSTELYLKYDLLFLHLCMDMIQIKSQKLVPFTYIRSYVLCRFFDTCRHFMEFMIRSPLDCTWIDP